MPGGSGSCGRSTAGFAWLWATSHLTPSFGFAACGGATTDDVRNSQLGGLTSATDLVSITIGGNDVGFFPAAMVSTSGTEAACEQQATSARTTIAQILPGKLDGAFQAIRRQAPNAAVVVLGYPRLFDPTADCPADNMTTFARQVFNAAGDHLDRVIADRAQAAGFTFVDVRARFAGHESCTRDAWLNTLVASPLAYSFHPNATGYAQGYLPALNAVTPPGF